MRRRDIVLEYIIDNPGCTPGGIVSGLNYSYRSVSMILRKLRNENLVKVIPSLQDMRVRHYYPNNVISVSAIENAIAMGC